MANPGPFDSARFSHRFRGYDPAEVDEHLRAVEASLTELRRDRDHLTARLEQVGERDVDFGSFAEEIRQILQAAQDAADGLRRRASEEVATWRDEAKAETDAQRSQALSDAEALRRDAWVEAESLWKGTQEGARIRTDEAEREALAIVGQAERDAHRMLSSARREAEEQLRLAKMEAERLLVEARAQHEEIIDSARKTADAAQERARALEVRRTELLDELESVRTTVAKLESDIDEKRAQLVAAAEEPIVEPEPAPADAPAKAEDREGWPTENIRIIPAQPKHVEVSETIDASDMADEVRRLRDTASSETTAEVPVVDQADPAPEADGGSTEPEPHDESELVTIIEPEPDTGSEPGPSETTADVEADVEPVAEVVDPTPKATADDLGGLFAALRSGGDEPGQPVQVASVSDSAEPAPDEDRLASAVVFDGDAADYRDHLLLPITNRILRSIKRQLTEAQNLALEEIRVTEGDWEPNAEELRERVHGDLTIVVQESFAAGYAAVEELTGASVGRPKPAKADIDDHAPAFAAALAEDLATVTSEASGPRAAAAALSRAYRAWRTDEAERRVGTAARMAFHKGLARAAKVGNVPALFWSVAGRGCPECRTLAEAGPVSPGQGFGPDRVLPPLHDGCSCAVVPSA